MFRASLQIELLRLLAANGRLQKKHMPGKYWRVADRLVELGQAQRGSDHFYRLTIEGDKRWLAYNEEQADG